MIRAASATRSAGRPRRPTGCCRTSCSARRIGARRSRCWRRTSPRCSTSPRRWSPAISRRCARWRARSCCPGFGMTICGGSYPASQGEHLISHYVDMFAPAGCATLFHGEQMAVATLTMARLQETSSPPARRDSVPRLHRDELLRPLRRRRSGESCWREVEAKRLTGGRGGGSSASASPTAGTELSDDLRARHLPRRLAAVLRRVGGPAAPPDIGLCARLLRRGRAQRAVPPRPLHLPRSSPTDSGRIGADNQKRLNGNPARKLTGLPSCCALRYSPLGRPGGLMRPATVGEGGAAPAQGGPEVRARGRRSVRSGIRRGVATGGHSSEDGWNTSTSPL